MTRDEAIKILTDDAHKSADWSETMVEAFVKLGMLKLDEPKSAQQKLREAMKLGPKWLMLEDWERVVDAAGLKIVEK